MKAVEVRNIKIGEGIPKICVPIVADAVDVDAAVDLDADVDVDADDDE